MVKARCPLHVNVTAALLDTLSDMQEQMTRIFNELDAENFRGRVEVLRVVQTAPGSDDAEESSFSAAPRPSSAAGGGKGKEPPPGSQDSAISRYRHREVLQYDDVFVTAWPADESVVPQRQSSLGGGGAGGKVGALGPLNTPRFPVCHEFYAPLALESRMSFTILNLTGQRMRYFQPRAGEETRRLQYLRVRAVYWNACC